MAKPIISFIILILSLGFALFYVMPAYDLNVARRGDIESLTKILSTSGEIKTLIGKTKDNLSSIDPTVMSRFEVFLPEKIDPIRFANNLQSIGRNNRIVLSDIKIEAPGSKIQKTITQGNGAVQGLVSTMSLGAKIDLAAGVSAQNQSSPESAAPTDDKRYVTTKATFGFTTSFESFQLFLNDLEKSLGQINITALSFAPVAEATDTKKSKTAPVQNYQYNMTIETYSLK